MTDIALARAALWHAIYGEVPTGLPLTSLDIAICRERLERFVDRYGEDKAVRMLRKGPGLAGIDLEKARALLRR